LTDTPEQEALKATFAETAGDSNGKPEEVTYEWLRSASDLLDMGEPGLVPYLVDGLLTERALGAIQGSYKTGKTWVILELAIAIASGRPAFGTCNVDKPGPVILVLEESGELDTRRRLSQMVRGYAMKNKEVANLYVSSNAGVKLAKKQGTKWREAIKRKTEELQPRAIIFDPLVRIKGGDLSENTQSEISEITDWLTQLQRHSEAAVCFAHHTGHQEKFRMRGSLDLEAWWSTKLAVTRIENTYTLQSEHREAPPVEPLEFALDWHEDTQSIRLRGKDLNAGVSLRQMILDYMTPLFDPISGNTLYAAIHRRRNDVLHELQEMEKLGLVVHDSQGWSAC
jgi:hypothetical protein